ncbi:MAG: hypothetical protein UV78_C0005G0047 [Parcubacteria group bacterium GW2011_GWA2_43_17]|nr:MAG: hypothetical protein UV78_C0005G0047 [Parcubacteria group bacterium GW2011_GWA2_43_17]KKT92856.1 MAG: hypothetical protein UW91_C0015G0027 [Parcubacteria group bacterium GW2011_GWF2_45_11]KKT98054.1 MAG: hypothetical protein UW98_C0011G0035 [Parcubacteria group bacterium GW2011_GWC2_45_15]
MDSDDQPPGAFQNQLTLIKKFNNLIQKLVFSFFDL